MEPFRGKYPSVLYMANYSKFFHLDISQEVLVEHHLEDSFKFCSQDHCNLGDKIVNRINQHNKGLNCMVQLKMFYNCYDTTTRKRKVHSFYS